MWSNTPESFSEVNDESLLLLGRMGKEVARDALAVRYYRKRRSICRHASPAIMNILDEWEANEAFFRGYLEAETSYRFGPVSFYSYALRCIKFALANATDAKLAKCRTMVQCSLDAPLGEEELSLADIVHEDQSPDDPRVFLNYAESLASLEKLPPHIHPTALEIARRVLAGFRIREIANQLEISEKRASYYFSRYKEWAKSTLAKIGVLPA